MSQSKRLRSLGCSAIVLAMIWAVLAFAEREDSPSAGAGLADAALAGDHEAMRQLLAGKLSIETPAASGMRPLQAAAFRGDVEGVRLLLQHGADPNARNARGCTALHLAVVSGNVDVLRELLWRGAEVNATDTGGRTPLYTAACFGNVSAVEWLLRRGADLRLRARDGSLPIDVAQGRPDVASMIAHAAAFKPNGTQARRTPAPKQTPRRRVLAFRDSRALGSAGCSLFTFA